MSGLLPDRLPPQSLDAEQAVLGAAMISISAVAVLLSDNRAVDFYLDAHRRIYEAIEHLRGNNQPVDVLTVPEVLRSRGLLDQIGGVAYINTLAESVPTAAHQKFYAKAVSEKATRRRMIDYAGDFITACYDQELEVEEIQQSFVTRVMSERISGGGQPKRVADLVRAEKLRIRERRRVPVMWSGIKAIDDFSGGIECAQIGYVSGEPGFGKTALIHQWAKNASASFGPGGIFSLEIKGEMMSRRLLASESGFTYRELRDFEFWSGDRYVEFLPDEYDFIDAAADRLAESTERLYVDDFTYSLDGMVGRAYELVSQYGVKFFVIDYVQLVEVRRAEGRTDAIRAVAQALKNRIAGDLNVPVVAISSLTKEGMKRQGGAGQADMDGAAALASDSSLSLLLTKDLSAAWDDKTRPVIGRFAKTRNGATGDLPLTFHAPRYLITARGESAESQLGRQEQSNAPSDADDPFTDAPLRGTAELPLGMAADYVGAASHYAERY